MLENVPAGYIAAIIPDYETNVGNVTIIVDKDGNKHKIYKRVKTMLKKLASIYAVDLTALRRKLSTVLNQQNVIPLPLDENLIFIPFKMRKPITQNDGSLGYINLSFIEKIEKNKGTGTTDVLLVNNIRIQAMTSYATACKHIKNAQIVKQYYVELHSENSNLHRFNELYGQYQKPATKNDIAILTDEIVQLKHYIKQIYSNDDVQSN